MIHKRSLAGVLFLSVAILGDPATSAQPGETGAASGEKAAPYDERLVRLSEILGSVQYLRGLCNAGKEDDWRADMQRFLDTETRDETVRRQKLTAAFNRGYRSFASVYTGCTAAALAAEQRYRSEGATLALEIAARFGN